MSHSYSQNHVHLVFSTKGRQKLIPMDFRPRLSGFMTSICKSCEIVPFAIGGMADHAHILFRLPPTITLSKSVSVLKANSSKWMSEHGTRFAWQEGYGAFSVSSSNVNAVIKYIDEQEIHHRRKTFEQEFITLLNKHGVSYDPKYVFG
jgi:REP element-mobilizing transposase RayT